MKKILTISGVECVFRSSAAVPRMYRIKFGRDIFIDLQNLKKQIDIQERLKEEKQKEAIEKGIEYQEESELPISSLEMFENIAYIMHKHGDANQPGNIDEWLEQFETFDIYEILPEILELWNLENKQMSSQKKSQEK